MFEPKLTPKQYIQRNHAGITAERRKLHTLELRMLSGSSAERRKIAKYANRRIKVIADLYQSEKLAAMLIDDGDYTRPFKVLASELVQIAKRYKLIAGNRACSQ